jgi:hypothetical protein
MAKIKSIISSWELMSISDIHQENIVVEPIGVE